MNCHKIRIIQGYEKGILGGNYSSEFTVHNILISINQSGIRTIELSYKNDGDYDYLYNIFCKVEKLCVLYEGKFLELHDFEVLDIYDNKIDSAQSFENIKATRLNYCTTIDVCRNHNTKLIDIFKFLDANIFNKWSKLLDELDLLHQIFLYNTSSIGFPVDCKVASLIEILEPTVELVTLYTNQFSSLKPGEKGTSLKMCIDALISMYGNDIFSKEYNKNSENFLQILVNSRIKVMHIKRKYDKKCLSGKESVLYILKLSLLYRNILLSLIGIDYKSYKDNLIKCITEWEQWQNVFQEFLNNL